MKGFKRQQEYEIRYEWGEKGVTYLSAISDVCIIVDVLSFTTSVDIATSQDAYIYPYQWKDNSINNFSKRIGAEMAGKDNPNKYSLKPSSLINLPPGIKLVLPSPNGSTLSTLSKSKLTIAGSLRNAKVVAEYAQQNGKSICVIASGERWDDNSTRFSLEDYLGAGAILSYLRGEFSPEAMAAKSIFECYREDLYEIISNSVSGKQKQSKNLEMDVRLACELNISHSIPVLMNGCYKNV